VRVWRRHTRSHGYELENESVPGWGQKGSKRAYSIERSSLTESSEQSQVLPLWTAVSLGAVLLLGAGAGYRVLSGQEERLALKQGITPPVLLRLPLELGAWHSSPVSLERSVVAAIKADAYLSRRYEDESTGDEVVLFVTAAANARAMLGHRPEICYPAIGWVLEHTRVVELATDGTPVKVRLQRFLRPGHRRSSQVVLSYFIVGGKATIDEADFRGLYWRRPTFAHDSPGHLLQVQVIATATSDLVSGEKRVTRFAEVSWGPLSSLCGRALVLE